jgi:hypothetical protein
MQAYKFVPGWLCVDVLMVSYWSLGPCSLQQFTLQIGEDKKQVLKGVWVIWGLSALNSVSATVTMCIVHCPLFCFLVLVANELESPCSYTNLTCQCNKPQDTGAVEIMNASLSYEIKAFSCAMIMWLQ